MADLEKVLKGLKKLRENSGCLAVYSCDCKTCPYLKVNGCCDQILADALELLKAQEPVKYTFDFDGDLICGGCGARIDGTDNYCRTCGRKVNWYA